MQEYKITYNKLLRRYNNGIAYISENPNEREKWFPEIQKIMQDLDNLVKKYSIPDENILTGFEV